MDAKTNFKSRLPSRHVTEGPERAPHRSCLYAMGLTSAPREFCTMTVAASGGSANAALHLPAIAHECECEIEFKRLDVAKVFKRTPYIADLKPGGRYVAKDMFEVGGIPQLMKALLNNGYLHGECMTVRGGTIAENLKSVKWNPDQDLVYPAGMTHPGGSHEKQSYADA